MNEDLAGDALPAVAQKAVKWRDALSATSVRQADYMWSFMSAVFKLAVADSELTANPCLMGGKLYDGSRVEKIWTLPQWAHSSLSAAMPTCTRRR